jgi:hypothetical protein
MEQKEIEFPDCWEEVKPLEWLHLLKNREKLMTKPGISLTDVKREWCAYVLKNRGYVFRSKVRDMLLVNELAQTLDWMWQAVEDTRDDGATVPEMVLTYDSTVNLMPEWRYLRGPMSHGADLTFGEFRHAVAALNKFNAIREPVYLQALCAVLYRPTVRKKGIVAREPFREQYMDRYMGLVKSMPEWMMWGVYAWFAYFCEYLFTGIFIIDGMELCFEPVFSRSKRDKDAQPGDVQSLGMNSILFSVAESGVFGNARATDDTLLLRVMMKLLDDKQRADEMMKNFKK